MRAKSELYKKEQIILSNKIINILNLDEHKSIILYYLDNDTDKINKILELIPELRKYFAFGYIKGLEYPDLLKRTWLSIVRQVTKITHTLSSKDKQITIDGKHIRTRLFTFTKK
jgi:hypothetical protein